MSFYKLPITRNVLVAKRIEGKCIQCGEDAYKISVRTNGLLALPVFLCEDCFATLTPKTVAEIIAKSGYVVTISPEPLIVHASSPFNWGDGEKWADWPKSHPTDLAILRYLYDLGCVEINKKNLSLKHKEKIRQVGLTFLDLD